MAVDFTVLEGGRFMTRKARRASYETICDGCGTPLTVGYVTVITDRSGSEQAVVHLDNGPCIWLAIDVLEQ